MSNNANSNTITGRTIYKTTGKTAGQIKNHVQKIGCGNKDNVPSRRGDCNVDFINQEATVIVQFTHNCDCGDELTIKHWGPGHSDGNCCWEVGCVNQSGEAGRMGEGGLIRKQPVQSPQKYLAISAA